MVFSVTLAMTEDELTGARLTFRPRNQSFARAYPAFKHTRILDFAEHQRRARAIFDPLASLLPYCAAARSLLPAPSRPNTIVVLAALTANKTHVAPDARGTRTIRRCVAHASSRHIRSLARPGRAVAASWRPKRMS
jgi:hypothetical protein